MFEYQECKRDMFGNMFVALCLFLASTILTIDSIRLGNTPAWMLGIVLSGIAMYILRLVVTCSRKCRVFQLDNDFLRIQSGASEVVYAPNDVLSISFYAFGDGGTSGLVRIRLSDGDVCWLSAHRSQHFVGNLLRWKESATVSDPVLPSKP